MRLGARWAAAIFVLAFAVRVLYILGQRANPLFAHPLMDQAYHDAWARELASGRWIGTDAFYRAPLYPYFLGVLYRFVTIDPLGVRLVQAALGSATAVLAGLLGARLFTRTTGIVAGLAAALYGMFVYFDAELLTVGLEVFLFTASLVAAEAASRDGRARAFAAAGILLGLAALTRPNFLALAPVFVLVFPLLGAPVRRAAVPFLAAVLVTIAPAFAYNAAVAEEVVPIAWNGGVNFYLGNHDGADGLSALGPRLRPSWWGGYEDAVAIAEEAAGRPLGRAEVSSHWTRQGLAFITAHPDRAAVLFARKIFYFWNGYEVPNNQDIAFFSRYSFLFRGPFLLGFGTIASLALFGAAASWRSRRARALVWIALAYAATVIAFFVCARYRLPVLPVLIVFAAEGARRIAQAVRARRWRLVAGAAIVVAAGAALARFDPEGLRRKGPASGFFNLGVAEAAAGRREAARGWYERAIEVDPDFAPALNNLGVLAAEGGDLDAAASWYERALRAEPASEDVLANFGTLADRLGDFTAAERYYRRALEASPFSYRTRADLGLVLLKAGRAEEAREELEEAAPHLPKAPEVWGNLGLARERSGDRTGAAEAYRRVLAIDSANDLARRRLEALEAAS